MVLKYVYKQARSYRAGRPGPVSAIILHSSDGQRAGDIETLTTGPVSAHWYVTRDGDVWHFVADADTAYHVGRADRPEHGNGRTIGIEQEHIDGKQDWPTAQVTAVAMIVHYLRRMYGDLPVLAHAAVAVPPGRKIDPQDYPWDRLSAAVANMAHLPITAERIST